MPIVCFESKDDFLVANGAPYSLIYVNLLLSFAYALTSVAIAKVARKADYGSQNQATKASKSRLTAASLQPEKVQRFP